LIYKRTHNGDPDSRGLFGVYDCMGLVRAWRFDAVIGVGGIGAEPTRQALDGKVNWIGIGPHRRRVIGKRGPIVTFDHFRFFGARGPAFAKVAPQLAGRMYSHNVRALMNAVSESERMEVEGILALAKNAPPSGGGGSPSRGLTKGCSR
jgi:hypothetical protein